MVLQGYFFGRQRVHKHRMCVASLPRTRRTGGKGRPLPAIIGIKWTMWLNKELGQKSITPCFAMEMTYREQRKETDNRFRPPEDSAL